MIHAASKSAGLFAADGAGSRVMSKADHRPRADAGPPISRLVRIDPQGRELQSIRQWRANLPDGGLLVIGRSIDELAEIAAIINGRCCYGILPPASLLRYRRNPVSLRAQRRLEQWFIPFAALLLATTGTAAGAH